MKDRPLGTKCQGAMARAVPLQMCHSYGETSFEPPSQAHLLARAAHSDSWGLTGAEAARGDAQDAAVLVPLGGSRGAAGTGGGRRRRRVRLLVDSVLDMLTDLHSLVDVCPLQNIARMHSHAVKIGQGRWHWHAQ